MAFSRSITSGLALVATALFAVATSHSLTINGHAFANAQFVNGQWAIALEDFAKATGNNLTLEPNFQLQGNRLVALIPSYSSADKHKIDSVQQKGAPGAIILQNVPAVQKAGEISRNVFRLNGRTYVPAADVVHAFGGRFTAPANNLAPGQPLNVSATVNGNTILAFH